ncbi:hypothetical protein IGI04_010125 [Brassica rapa subsp. trilocularis]|uniref:Uncharacterized protein n=1 Tax=Brassica rapa subsp. trilocularis TaxID=1813537 RepID=A0ABQ7N1K7_BRACM|nr:hypothetical protein IGI04_010125 [Brassica rapa subsp. trilocularis]
MGCGSSRLGGGAAARAGEGGVVPLPEGIRPLLRRRLEEMKKRSHASVLKGNQTQSKKELLRHGSSEDGEEAEENDDSLKLSAKVAPAPDHHVEDKKEVIYEKISSIKDVKNGEKVVKKQDEKIDDKKMVKTRESRWKPKITTQENESIVKKEKKERKGKRFGMALPRKYLANVTAPCYAGAGRGCMGNNTDHSRVVQEKSSQ